MKKKIYGALKCSTSSAAITVSLALLLAPAAWADGKVFSFNIPAENAAKALNDFSLQGDIQILFPYDVAVVAQVPALKGSFSRDDALAHILATTNLEIASETPTAIALRVRESPSAEATPTEVIVTGTHIRGANPTSPVHTVTRKDIEQSGYSQIGDVIHSLPENFGGGQNPGVIGASASNLANDNYTNAATINLRGLGTDATLVLLNGHRMSADYFFQGADISGIPLAAVQRIEIVPDGASALYGSDAVAGVANIITRRNYSGAELTGSIGTTAQGGGTLKNISLVGGGASDRGYWLANLEYASQSEIRADQRQFTADTPGYTTLLNPQERTSLFLGAGLRLNPRAFLTWDALLNQRYTKTRPYFSDTYVGTTRTPAYNTALSLDYDMTSDWKLRATAVASGSRNKARSIDSGVVASTQLQNDMQYIELTADGVGARLPTGDLKLAFGSGYREDHFVVGTPSKSNYQKSQRSVTYAYAEALVPLVSPSETRVGLKALELSLSARAENYSDFGSSTNPKIGLRYVPTDSLTARASWGTSFKAPSFYQAYQKSEIYLFPAAILGYAGPNPDAAAMWVLGGNPDLKPETSTSWTLGADYSPANLKSLKLSATYFNIDYTGRVVQPVPDVSVAFSNPNYAPFVELNPSAVRQSNVLAAADEVYNYTGVDYDPSSVVGILNDAYQNASAQTVSGIDVSYRQTFTLRTGMISAFANATWLRLNQQTIETVPNVRLSGTIFNAPDRKARAGLTWQNGGLSWTGVANYISGETDTGVIPNVEIASWTTLDTTLSYQFGERRGYRISLTASNLLDKAPPRAVSPAISVPGLYFDSTNSSILGRFVSLALTKVW